MNNEEIYKRILELPDNKVYFIKNLFYNGEKYFKIGCAEVDKKKYYFLWSFDNGILKDSIERAEDKK